MTTGRTKSAGRGSMTRRETGSDTQLQSPPWLQTARQNRVTFQLIALDENGKAIEVVPIQQHRLMGLGINLKPISRAISERYRSASAPSQRRTAA
jgi:hypothetical protein